MAGLPRRLWEGWKRIARRIGEFQSRVILTGLYFLLFGPLLPFIRSRDPLRLRRPPTWHSCQCRSVDLGAAARQ